MPLYLLAVFGKNEKANITAEEMNHLSKAVKELVAYLRQRNEQGLRSPRGPARVSLKVVQHNQTASIEAIQE